MHSISPIWCGDQPGAVMGEGAGNGSWSQRSCHAVGGDQRVPGEQHAMVREVVGDATGGVPGCGVSCWSSRHVQCSSAVEGGVHCDGRFVESAHAGQAQRHADGRRPAQQIPQK